MLCFACSTVAAAGIIHNVERPEDEHYKLLVTDLAERYMRRPGTVIVATITCTADIDTQVRGTAVHKQQQAKVGSLSCPWAVEDVEQQALRDRPR